MIEKVLQKDLFLKIAAVIVALLVWYTITAAENPLETKQVRVDLPALQAPPGMILRDQSVSQTTITFQGRRHSLEKIKDAEVSIVPIDISKAPAGRTTYTIEYVCPYSGVTVTDIYPSQVTVTLTPEEHKQVGIVISVRGTPNKEFIAGAATYEEQGVTVTGAKSDVERVAQVTGEIDVTGAVAEVNNKVSLVPRDRYGDEVYEVTVDSSEIQVTVPMTAKKPAKKVSVKVDVVGHPRKGFKFAGSSATPDEVVIRGDPTTTASISELVARINVDGKDASFTSSVNLIVPRGVELEDTDKVNVHVEIQEDIVTRTFPEVIVQLLNPPVDFKWTINPITVEMRLIGRSDILDQIHEGEIPVFIDAGNINVDAIGSSQTYQPPVNWGPLPEGVKADITPAFVGLTLTRR